MTRPVVLGLLAAAAAAQTAGVASAATAGKAGGDPLFVVRDGKTGAIVVASGEPGPQERLAVADLRTYVKKMSGVEPELANTPETVGAALASARPLLIVGGAALRIEPTLAQALRRAAKKKPILRADAIVLRRAANRVYLAGSNDASHYYAVAELLRRWGCRWFMPTAFGECIPVEKTLAVGRLDHAYGSPFEIRTYWISWKGDRSGARAFQRRNMMTDRSLAVPTGHAIGRYVKGLGKSVFHVALTDPNTAEHVARQVEKKYASGESFSLGMEDGAYSSDYPKDRKLMKLQWDKYFLRWSVTDAFLELYNNVARILRTKYPGSDAKIGFLAYANMTIPPVRPMKAERSLFCELAPIDIDPIHGMDDPQSPPRQEYKRFLYKWAEVMDGRLTIYDYDQGMLVWRDIPSPSHQAFAPDVRHYRKAGILGVNTESRNAVATTFTNLYMRGRLLWNPDEDPNALLEDFYKRFYGPAAGPMRDYWTAIFEAWEATICTEHEYFVAPAIYTPELLALMKQKLEAAERKIASLRPAALSDRRAGRVLERMAFTRMSYEIAAGYLGMVRAACRECDYARAAEIGEKALAVRDKLTDMNGIFTTYRNYKVEQRGYAWWPGEVKQYRELAAFTDGSKGTLVTRLALEWAFRRDPGRRGIEEEYATAPVDLSYWQTEGRKYTLDDRRTYPTDRWEMLRTDLYMQAQGVRHPDRQSYTGYGWYRTAVELAADKLRGDVHLRFPGLFNACRLFVNGREVASRDQKAVWWRNDYRFEWDVDLAGVLKPGRNELALVVDCKHHMGGMFRRPFLYRRTEE